MSSSSMLMRILEHHLKSRIMVNVKDLMVGNFVKTPIGVVEVYNIINDAIIADTRDICYAKGLDGIEVTKELLEKIGFKEDTALVKFYRYWDKDYKYKLDVDEGYTNSGKKWSVHIDNGDCATIGSGEFDYVHELQNLVRVITGHSLPITKDMIEDV